LRLSSAWMIFDFCEPLVEGNSKPALPAYTTIATLSCVLSLFTSIFNDAFTRGSLLASFMEPDTSIKKTRLEGGRSLVEIFLACIPTLSNLLVLFQGQSVNSVVMEIGSSCLGCG